MLCCKFFFFSEVNNQFLGFVDVEQQIVLCAPFCKTVNFLLKPRKKGESPQCGFANRFMSSSG